MATELQDTERTDAAEKRSVSFILAAGITWILNPLIVPPIALYFAASFGTGSDSEALGVLTRAALVYVILPLAVLFVLWRNGKIATFEVRARERRLLPLGIGLILAVLAIPIVAAGASSSVSIVRLIAITVAIEAALIALVTTRFKISIHVAAYSALATTLGWLQTRATILDILDSSVLPMAFLLACTAIPIVVWARIRVEAHTGKECLAGFFLGAFATIGILAGLAPLSG